MAKAQQMKWEYAEVNWLGGGHSVVESMNKRGALGWQFVSANADHTHVIMMRPVVDDATPASVTLGKTARPREVSEE